MENKSGITPVVPEWYIEFREAVMIRLPRDIDPNIADGWVKNQEALEKVLHSTLLPGCNIYQLNVDYDRSVENGVKAGCYDEFDPRITSLKFPTKRHGESKIEVELIAFNGNDNISMSKAERKLDWMGYRPINIHELLSFGEKYPHIQRKYRIIALGSTALFGVANLDSHPSALVPCLSRLENSSKRILTLDWIGFGWDDICRFAAVRK